MPDWFYRTVSRPVLFRLPAATARGLALGFMGRLARLPLGSALINFLGHLSPDARLKCTHAGLNFPSAIGLGPDLDAGASALPALARFGFGFLEVGPITVAAPTKVEPIERRVAQQAIWLPSAGHNLKLSDAAPRLAEAARLSLPLIARIGYLPAASARQTSDEAVQIVQALAPLASLFSLATLCLARAADWDQATWSGHVGRVLEAARAASLPRGVMICVPADLELQSIEPWLAAALEMGAVGLQVEGCLSQGAGRLCGAPAREASLALVAALRNRFGSATLLIGAGGVHEPEQALALKQAGADLVQLDSGLVYSGPGLAKRINDALLYEITAAASVERPVERAVEMTWLWTVLLGAGMFGGGLLALVIAATRVVLPYDEAFVGMSREELIRVNPRLLEFMAHDRISLTGTMVACGAMYLGLSLFGIRQGRHWARQAVLISAFTGFGSFFLFLGFGYLDPFHAFVTVVLLQLLLMGVHCRLRPYVPSVPPVLRGDRAWRLSLWGQLILIFHACGLLGAGVTISVIGSTHVFVPEDLEFMQTTAAALHAAHPRLVPLVAHDRATLGGMLLASGWVFLLSALWGMNHGTRWLWWTMLAAGIPAYAAAIGVHYSVGYTDPMHLLPAFAGLGIFLGGLALAYPYMCGEAGERMKDEKEWRGASNTSPKSLSLTLRVNSKKAPTGGSPVEANCFRVIAGRVPPRRLKPKTEHLAAGWSKQAFQDHWVNPLCDRSY